MIKKNLLAAIVAVILVLQATPAMAMPSTGGLIISGVTFERSAYENYFKDSDEYKKRCKEAIDDIHLTKTASSSEEEFKAYVENVKESEKDRVKDAMISEYVEKVEKDTGLKLLRMKGSQTGYDPNEEYFKFPDKILDTCARYTQKDGTPYTGLYLRKNSDSTLDRWIVLDKDGFFLKNKSEMVYACDNGRLCGDYVFNEGPSYGKTPQIKYLAKKEIKDGAPIFYMIVNNWLNVDGKWYRSDADGLLYREKWFQENGKWYTFDITGAMVKNTWVPGGNNKWYYLGEDGAMAINQEINGHWINGDGVVESSWRPDLG